MRATGAERLHDLLDDVKGKGLCVSLLLDMSVRVQKPEQSVLAKVEILQKVDELKNKLEVSEEDVCQIERSTRDQAKSLKWFEVRRFRLILSLFGRMRQLKPQHPRTTLSYPFLVLRGLTVFQ